MIGVDGSPAHKQESRVIAASLSSASVKFGEFTALRDISLDIEAGDFWTILGPSGCGKSTMLRLVSDLLPPATGTVEILGKTTEQKLRYTYYRSSLIFRAGLGPTLSISQNQATTEAD